MDVKKLTKLARRYFDEVEIYKMEPEVSTVAQHYRILITGGDIVYCYHMNHNIYHVAVKVTVPDHNDAPDIILRARQISTAEIKRILLKASTLMTSIRDGTHNDYW